MDLPFFIARRYLFARKSHNVINLISAVSAGGMAIGTAALVIILSVYNGFDSIVKSTLSNVEPDLMIKPREGKVFIPEGPAFDWAATSPEIKTISSVLEERVYVDYDGRGGIAKAKGVDEVYEKESPLRDRMTEGSFELHKGSVPEVCVGAGLAFKMGISPRYLAGMDIYFPSREGNFRLSSPASSLMSERVWPSGLFSVNADIDNNLMIVPIEVMRSLLEYEDEVSAVEIRLVPGASIKKVASSLSKMLGPSFVVADRYRQNESLYKMMRYEKSAVYLILVFVIIIIAFNIFGSLTMLIIEKEGDIATLRSMGAGEKLVRRIFVLEGWLISLLGLGAGILIGLLSSWIQMHFGLIKMPSSFMTSAYPVIIQWSDILVIAASVAVIGYLIAWLPVKANISPENKKAVAKL